MSRAAREGEQVDAAAWKSTNLRGEESDGGRPDHRKPGQEGLNPWGPSAGKKLQDPPAVGQVKKMKPRDALCD